MNKFRPQDLPKSYVMKQRLKTGRADSYNWQTRVEWYPANWTRHQQMLSKRFAHLHYLSEHAPAPIQQRWKHAGRAFMKKHFGDAGRGSMRYLNKWSCHSWL
jgi:hypothetical protein